MKKLIQFTLLSAVMLSCSQDDDENAAENCYLSSITASNSPATGFVVENGKLVGTTYGGTRSDAVYTYDTNGTLTKIETGTTTWLYFYDSNGKLTRYEIHNDGVHEVTGEYIYSGGFPKTYLRTGNLNADVHSLLEVEYEYLNGNPVKETAYIYSSGQDRGSPLVTTTKYDSKKNPYNTLADPTTLWRENNPIEYRYEGRPEQDTDIHYTYNENGYPITYEQVAINRTDYPNVTGTYEYQCK